MVRNFVKSTILADLVEVLANVPMLLYAYRNAFHFLRNIFICSTALPVRPNML